MIRTLPAPCASEMSESESEAAAAPAPASTARLEISSIVVPSSLFVIARSETTKQSRARSVAPGLLRFARNDGSYQLHSFRGGHRRRGVTVIRLRLFRRKLT